MEPRDIEVDLFVYGLMPKGASRWRGEETEVDRMFRVKGRKLRFSTTALLPWFFSLTIISTGLSLNSPVARAQATASSQENEWVNTTSNCLVGAPGQPFLSVEWSGACVDGFAEGPGTQTWRQAI